MATTLTELSDEQIEDRRADIQTQIESLRAEFKALGLELERRRTAGDLDSLEAQKAELEKKIALAKGA